MKVCTGLKESMPGVIVDGELYICNDTKEKFIGSKSGNIPLQSGKTFHGKYSSAGQVEVSQDGLGLISGEFDSETNSVIFTFPDNAFVGLLPIITHCQINDTTTNEILYVKNTSLSSVVVYLKDGGNISFDISIFNFN